MHEIIEFDLRTGIGVTGVRKHRETRTLGVGLRTTASGSRTLIKLQRFVAVLLYLVSWYRGSTAACMEPPWRCTRRNTRKLFSLNRLVDTIHIQQYRRSTSKTSAVLFRIAHVGIITGGCKNSRTKLDLCQWKRKSKVLFQKYC